MGILVVLRRVQMQSPEVARIGIKAMLKERSSIIPGFQNSLAAWSVRLAPRRIATAVAGFFMRAGARDSLEG